MRGNPEYSTVYDTYRYLKIITIIGLVLRLILTTQTENNYKKFTVACYIELFKIYFQNVERSKC